MPAPAPFAQAGSSGRPAAAAFYKAPRGSLLYDWTGFYVGAEGGYAFDRSSGTLATATGAALTSYNYDAVGPFSGPFLGANYQLGRLVLGAEGDWMWANLIGSSEDGSPYTLPAGAFPGGPFTVSTTMKDYGSIRGRIGISFNRFMAYATGGWAFGNPSIAYALAGSAPFLTHGGYSYGWTAGAGIDYAFTDHVFGRVEYRYTSLETSAFVNAASNVADAGTKVPINDFRAGLAYKFGPGPIFAAN
jgi:outer membrane immunogenic protein